MFFSRSTLSLLHVKKTFTGNITLDMLGHWLTQLLFIIISSSSCNIIIQIIIAYYYRANTQDCFMLTIASAK